MKVVRLFRRVAFLLLLGLAALYGGDYLAARYRIPNNRVTLGTVEVRTSYAVRLKNGKIEYSLGDTYDQTCLRSLFPHLGYETCWYLRRHPENVITIGRGGKEDKEEWNGDTTGVRVAWNRKLRCGGRG